MSLPARRIQLADECAEALLDQVAALRKAGQALADYVVTVRHGFASEQPVRDDLLKAWEEANGR